MLRNTSDNHVMNAIDRLAERLADQIAAVVPPDVEDGQTDRLDD